MSFHNALDFSGDSFLQCNNDSICFSGRESRILTSLQTSTSSVCFINDTLCDNVDSIEFSIMSNSKAVDFEYVSQFAGKGCKETITESMDSDAGFTMCSFISYSTDEDCKYTCDSLLMCAGFINICNT